MKHITFADKSFLLGDEAADAVLKYAAVLARAGSADTVTVHAISSDGDEVEATMLLDAGAPIMAETTHSSVPEPENEAAMSYIRAQVSRLTESAEVTPDYAPELDDYGDESDSTRSP